MKRLFKKFFIPHEHNDWKPHFLRVQTGLVILAAAFFVEMLLLNQIYVVLPHSSYLASILPNVLVDLTNSDRASMSEAPLKVNSVLEKAAAKKAQDMAAKGYFQHVSPDGTTPWYWFKDAGYTYSMAGENLAVNFVDSKDVVDAWMKSPGHRANLLNKNFTEIGIGTASGVYQGRETVYIVQLFGRPAKTAPAAVVALVTPVGTSTPATPRPTTTNQQNASSAIASASAVKPVTTSTLNPAAQMSSTSPLKPVELRAPTEIAMQQVKGLEMYAESDAEPMPAPDDTALVRYSSLAMRIASMPRQTVNLFFLAVIGLLGLALILKLSIKVKHPVLLVNAAILLIVLSGFVTANHYLLGSLVSVF